MLPCWGWVYPSAVSRGTGMFPGEELPCPCWVWGVTAAEGRHPALSSAAQQHWHCPQAPSVLLQPQRVGTRKWEGVPLAREVSHTVTLLGTSARTAAREGLRAWLVLREVGSDCSCIPWGYFNLGWVYSLIFTFNSEDFLTSLPTQAWE